MSKTWGWVDGGELKVTIGTLKMFPSDIHEYWNFLESMYHLYHVVGVNSQCGLLHLRLRRYVCQVGLPISNLITAVSAVVTLSSLCYGFHASILCKTL